MLMDVNMPELDGFELAAMIRQHPRCERTAIIFVSAVHLSDLDRVRGYETGAVDYVSVPVVPEILRAKVGVFADLYRKTTELERLNRTLEERVLGAHRGAREHDRASCASGSSACASRARRSPRPTGARPSFSRCSRTSCAIPCSRSGPRSSCCARRARRPSRLAWARDVIDRQVNHLVRLVDDLLDASRISSGKLELRLGRIDLVPVVLARWSRIGRWPTAIVIASR